MTTTPVLTRVNCLLRIPGFGEVASVNMRFDPRSLALHVRTEGPLGTVCFTPEDTFPVELLDLDVPTVLRNQMKNDGWKAMPMSTVIKNLRDTFLKEQ